MDRINNLVSKIDSITNNNSLTYMDKFTRLHYLHYKLSTIITSAPMTWGSNAFCPSSVAYSQTFEHSISTREHLKISAVF